ncbi:MAG: FAD binding domain-containing protein [Clostridia bacterium]|nr:FAD binding domain-containing protein [Clostridia bacterium]
MLTIEKYLRPATLEEAYQAAQQKNSVVLGGMLWLRLGSKRVSTAIDLSGLGLDYVTETENCWRIGAYTSLRTLETHTGLNALAGGGFRDALCSIVGVQFRNLATVGGSIFGRYGFSDVVTLCMALDASVSLYRGGLIPLETFCGMGKVNDILTEIQIPKKPVRVSWQVQRNTATDFPVLNVCAVRREDSITIAVGARPLRAVPYRFAADPAEDAEKLAAGLADAVAEQIVLGDNNRASGAYRRHLCRVLIRRAVRNVLTEKEEC